MVSKMSLLPASALLVVAFLATATARTRFASRYNYIEQNSLSPVGGLNGVDSGNSERMQDWVKVNQSAGRIISMPEGQRIELECEAIGSPTPMMQWLKGARPVVQGVEESNEISVFGLGKMVLRYIIDCVEPVHQGIYTCTAVSGTESVVTPSTTVIVERNLPSFFRRCGVKESAPRITMFSSVIMQTMNSDVTIPCRVHGNPKPNIIWAGKDEQIIQNTPGSRFKILRNGDLVISKLQWADMGGYTCIAENKLGRDTASTFLYPMLSED